MSEDRLDSGGGSSTTFMWPLVRQLDFLDIYVCNLLSSCIIMWYVISKLKTKQGVEYNQQYLHFLTHTTTETANEQKLPRHRETLTQFQPWSTLPLIGYHIKRVERDYILSC